MPSSKSRRPRPRREDACSNGPIFLIHGDNCAPNFTSDLAQSHQVTEINPNVTPDSLPLVCPEPIPTMPVCVGLSQNMSIAADPHMMTQPLTLCDGVSDSPCNCCDPQTCTLLNGDVPYMTEVSSLGCRLCDLEVNAGENGYHNQYEAPEKVAYPVDPPKQQSTASDPPSYEGPFSNPVYKKLSRINGEVNKMSYSQLKERLTQLGMDNRGFKDVLKKRLKTFYKKQSLVAARVPPQPKNSGQKKDEANYLIVIDFEATCEEKNYPEYPHEIIEFPAVVIDTNTMQVVEKFHSFVRPNLKPTLTKFCSNLTGISQETVDKAPDFVEVLQSFEDWLEKLEYFSKYRSAVVTDGPWDMCRFMVSQCKLSRIKIPIFARKWCNIRKVFGNFYGTRRLRLIEMLFHLGLTFEGKPHSGLDDAHNIATVALRLLQDGASLSPNEKLQRVIIQKVGRHSLTDGQEDDDSEDCDDDEEEDHKENLAWALQMLELKDSKLYDEDEETSHTVSPQISEHGDLPSTSSKIRPLMEL